MLDYVLFESPVWWFHCSFADDPDLCSHSYKYFYFIIKNGKNRKYRWYGNSKTIHQTNSRTYCNSWIWQWLDETNEWNSKWLFQPSRRETEVQYKRYKVIIILVYETIAFISTKMVFFLLLVRSRTLVTSSTVLALKYFLMNGVPRVIEDQRFVCFTSIWKRQILFEQWHLWLRIYLKVWIQTNSLLFHIYFFYCVLVHLFSSEYLLETDSEVPLSPSFESDKTLETIDESIREKSTYYSWFIYFIFC